MTYKLLEYADDGPVPCICLLTASGHLHVVSVDTLDSLERSRQIKLQGEIVNNLPLIDVSTQEDVQDMMEMYLVVQALYTGYSLCLLERVDPNSRLVGNGLELLVDVVQDLVVHL
jgi:hypothetical protein